MRVFLCLAVLTLAACATEPTRTQKGTAVGAGVEEAMARGGTDGFPIVDVRAVCTGGKYHAVDSSDMAFQAAARGAFRELGLSNILERIGDGSLGYSIAEFDTFIRHGLPVIAVVGNDACWSQIAREQVKLLEDDTAVMLGRTDYHRVVAGFGAGGLLIERDDESADVLAQARDVAAGGHAVLVNALLDRSDFREGSISI